MWPASGTLALLGAIPFALYGLAAALLFRSEAAVSAASGILVVLAFFGNLFMPLSGTMLAIAKYTPVYGIASLTRWPQLEGAVADTTGSAPASDPLWTIVLNVVAWTAVFAAICLAATRRRTRRTGGRRRARRAHRIPGPLADCASHGGVDAPGPARRR